MKINLKQARTNKGYTQQEIADMFNISVDTYQKYEQGKREPKYETLCKLADLFNVTTDYILDREQPKEVDSLTEFIREMGLSDSEEMLVRIFFAVPKNKREKFVAAFCESVDEYTAWKQEEGAEQEAVCETATTMEVPRKPIKTIALSDIGLSAGSGNLVLDSYGEDIEIYDEKYAKADVAFKVVGKSMAPEYQDGQLAYVHSQPQVEIGEIGAFLYDGMQFIKKFAQHNGVYILESLNKDVDDEGNRIYPDIEIKDDSFRCYGKVLN